MTRVFVGMSGGVDSSVTAALMIEQGYDVTGVYMKNWSQDLPGLECPWKEDLADAKRVAVQLGIDFEVFDFEREYKQKVVDYMLDEYRAGRTPNPDIMCNQEVKFRLFLDTARERGADFIATGHYARTQNGILKTAADTAKDQTYFLYRVTNQALRQTFFPLGDFTKKQVRDMAKKRNLWTAQKKESMGVCFVGNVGMRDFLSEYVSTAPGDILEEESRAVLGRHSGALFYTLGQRHGLDVGGGLPYYVVGKNMEKNQVYVSKNRNHGAMWRRQLQLADVHWINDAPADNDKILVRMRHRGAFLPATFRDKTLFLSEAERAVAPGQSAVIYRGDVCLGGGIVL